MLYLRDSDIRNLAEPGKVLEWMKLLFAELGKGAVILPDRTVIDVGKGKGSILSMPAFIPGVNAAGIKVVSVFPGNRHKNLPSINAHLFLIDPETGKTIAVMEATSLTALRTAAVSALAADLLARKSASRLGIFGAGVQAEYHLRSLHQVRPLKEVRVYDSDYSKSKDFAERMKKALPARCPIHAVKDESDAVKGSDLLLTATTSSEPVFSGSDVQAGTHITAIGSFKPGVRELDDETIERSVIVVDSKGPALAEAGDLIIPIRNGRIKEDHVKADLGELVTGTKDGRTNEEEITLFKSVGLAAEDVVAAKKIFEMAAGRRMGVSIAGGSG